AKKTETSPHRDRPGAAPGGCARRPRALEEAPSRGRGAPRACRRAGRLDARALVDLDPHPHQPAARPGKSAPASGAPGPRRENLLELIGAGGLELVVAAFRRRLVRAPAQKRGRVAEAVALQVIVFHLAHALDAQRLPRQVLARAPAALAARHALRAALGGLGPFPPPLSFQRLLSPARHPSGRA